MPESNFPITVFDDFLPVDESHKMRGKKDSGRKAKILFLPDLFVYL